MPPYGAQLVAATTAAGLIGGLLLHLVMGMPTAKVFELTAAAMNIGLLTAHGAGVGRAGWRGLLLTTAVGMATVDLWSWAIEYSGVLNGTVGPSDLVWAVGDFIRHPFDI